jgi:hypothetical protein
LLTSGPAFSKALANILRQFSGYRVFEKGVAVFPRQPRRLRYVSQASRLLKTAALFLNLLQPAEALVKNGGDGGN